MSSSRPSLADRLGHSPSQLLTCLLAAVCGVTAALALGLGPAAAPPPFVGVVVVVAACAPALRDGMGAPLFLAATGLLWAVSPTPVQSSSVLVAAVALLTEVVLLGVSATAPRRTALRPAVLTRWARRWGILVGLTVLTWAAAQLATGLGPTDPVLRTALALVALLGVAAVVLAALTGSGRPDPPPAP